MAEGSRKPVHASGGPPITSLSFVDDLILFGEATMVQAALTTSAELQVNV